MDYGTVIQDAWRLTWRYRFLWLLAVFAGGASGLSGGGNPPARWGGDAGELEQLGPGVARTAEGAASGLLNNPGLIATIAIGAAALGLVLLAVSFIAQGGMARATADLAAGQPVTLGQAWRAGLNLVWRYVGLWLLLVAVGVAVVGLIAALVAAVVASALMSGDAPNLALLALGLIVGIPLALAAIALAVGLSIVVAYAQRAIAVQDLGPVAALRSGWQLFRGHIGASLLAWLINVALGVAAGLALAVVLGVVAVVLGGIGLALWSALGASAVTIGYAALGGLAALVALLVVAGISNTFFWHYWTLVYLRLRPGAPEPA